MQPQSPPGRWYFVPDQTPTPQRDTRFIRNGWEWLLFLSDCAAIGFVLLHTIGSQIAAGWRW